LLQLRFDNSLIGVSFTMPITQEVSNMNVAKTPGRIHPLLAAAAVSVTLVSLIGVAAITGILPNSHSTPNPNATPDTSMAAAPGNAAEPASKVAENEAPAQQPVSQSHHHHSTATHHAPSRSNDSSESTTVATAAPVCENCGRVEAVEAIKHEAKPSGGGAIAGAILGGVLGNQVGGGNGRKLATVAGAVGGGFAGNTIEKNARATTTYDVRVRMEDGSVRNFSYSAPPGWSAGDHVRVVNGTLAAQG
jgi:outer membrane lipoprotein SlyB